MIDKTYINNLPQVPAVYLFKNEENKVIYVGKAINLRSRAKSYLDNPQLLGPKTTAMVSTATKLDYILVQSEIEALLLEADLIKRLKPKYNINLKDDKFYALIEIFFQKKLRSIRIVRRQKGKTSKYFGPFPDGNTAREVLKTLRRAYPYADCSPTKFARYKKIGRGCLYQKIGLCQAPCVTCDFKTNNSNVTSISKLLTTGKSSITSKLTRQMTNLSNKQMFEEATKIRDLLISISYVSQTITKPVDYINNPNLNSDTGANELVELQNTLNLSKIPERIEFYDISNISGKHAVASMVVLQNGTPQKSEYRRFKIKLNSDPNDFAMIAEVISRRMGHLEWQKPNLVVVDGGKGQVSSALSVLANIPLVGLAKKQETIITSTLKEIHLPKTSPALKLLMRGRDESHRFAKAYFSKLLLRTIGS